MLHGIFKQHQIHGCIELIVALQGICKDGPEHRPVCNRSIGGFLTHLGKVAIEEGLLCHLFVLQPLDEDKHNKSFQCFSQRCYLKVKSSKLYSYILFIRIWNAPQSIHAQSPSGASGRAAGPCRLPVCLSTLCRTRGATAVPGQCCLSWSLAQRREFPE